MFILWNYSEHKQSHGSLYFRQNISVHNEQDSFLWFGFVPFIMVKVFEKKTLLAKQSELCWVILEQAEQIGVYSADALIIKWNKWILATKCTES